MGGGAAMRAAAKVAGIGIATGLRGGATAEFPASLLSKAVRPASAGVVSSSLEKAGGLTVEPAVQTVAWDVNDWDFAGDVDDGLIVDRIDAGNLRVVFGPVPSLQEAKDATSELKDALEKVYLSSPQSSGAVSSLQETKACITHESSIPRGAMEAFMLLKEQPAVQTVVASIACDPNVWNAMMQNPDLVEFLESEKNCAEFGAQESPRSSVGSSEAEEPRKSDGFRGFIKDIKDTVQDMVNSLSKFTQKLFSEPDEGKKSESSDGTFWSFFPGGSLMALVMMVIMMVVLKRV